MAMTRELPPNEWHRLLELGSDIPDLPDARRASIIVQEDAVGDIIGFWMVMQIVHIEPAWVRPDHRGGLVVARMWQKVREFLDNCSIKRAFCFTSQPQVADYLGRLGLEHVPEKAFLWKEQQTEASPRPKTLGAD